MPKKGEKMSEKQKEKIANSNKNKHNHKGKNNPMFGRHFSIESRKKMSLSRIGNTNGKGNKGKSFFSIWNKFHKNIGEKNGNWKGGKTNLITKIRNSQKGIEWRISVFKRDDFTCQECKRKGCYLEAHHIVRLADIIHIYNINTFEDALKCEIIWKIKNGKTLCDICHEKTKKFDCVNKRMSDQPLKLSQEPMLIREIK